MSIESNFLKITKENILAAIFEVDREGVPKGFDSQYYDVVYAGKPYPPKVLVSKAYRFATGEIIKNTDFSGGEESKAFAILRDCGFTIVKKDAVVLTELLQKFIENSMLINRDRTKASLKTKEYDHEFKDTKIRVSFGQGGFTDVPWFGFLNYGQTIQKGIYPVILFLRNKNVNNLEVCFGISETETPGHKWKPEYLYSLKNSGSVNFPLSYVNDSFTINSTADFQRQASAILKSVNDVIEKFHKQFNPAKVDAIENYLVAKDHEVETLPVLQTLNTIFYGPPGTGKTSKATELISEFKKSYKVTQKANISTFMQDLSWHEVIALVMHDLGGKNIKVPQIEDHQYIKDKLAGSNNKSLKNTIWNALQSHTAPESKSVKLNHGARLLPYLFDKNDKSEWSLEPSWQEDLANIFEEYKKAKTGSSKMVENTKFVTFHQSYSYEDFIEGIRPVSRNGELKYEILPGSFKSFCDTARGDLDNKYLFVIDEINRGNISKIFGELITSIEDSKRFNPKVKNHCIPIALQYSTDTLFTVPHNVYIVGTMNTADRSIAMLDIALRRRFVFERLFPDVSKVEEVQGVELREIFETLNNKIKVLIGEDYQIGHTYFMNLENNTEKLKQTWFHKILPLLNEYFYGDFEKLSTLVGPFIVSSEVNVGWKSESIRESFRLKIIDEYPVDSQFVEDLNSLK
jgi:DNA polymerase III delta prime subunit